MQDWIKTKYAGERAMNGAVDLLPINAVEGKIPVLPFDRAAVAQLIEQRNIRALSKNEMLEWYDTMLRYGYDTDASERALDRWNETHKDILIPKSAFRAGKRTKGIVLRPKVAFRPIIPVKITLTSYIVGRYPDKKRGSHNEIDLDVNLALTLDRFEDFGDFDNRLEEAVMSAVRADTRFKDFVGIDPQRDYEGDYPAFKWELANLAGLSEMAKKAFSPSKEG